MADGTFAVLMLIAGLTDMTLNHCKTDAGCLGKTDVDPRLSLAVGEVIERNAIEEDEIYIRYDLGHNRGPFGNAMGFSVSENGAAWIGFGTTYKKNLGSTPVYAELHSMPGLYLANDGFDLGGPIAFRSGVEIGYEAPSGWRAAISYDHRSNAGIYDDNPGIEMMQFRVSVPLK